ncbi:DUF1579 family protein [Pontibacter toksunensis]|uniref:DUF1579 family protein n=1 Tax=Pontibacter toksunensis TaxID=1332631 RepID=A0ABW6BWD8_9BACT
MKKIISFLFAAALLVGAAPVTQAQNNTPLTAKQAEANQLLQRIVGNWQVSRYEKQHNSKELKLAKGNTKFTKGLEGDYVHELSKIKNTDGSSVEGESFIRYSETMKRYEHVQVDKNGKSIVVMVGKWSPKYNALTFRPLTGEGQWSSKVDPNMQCVYLFKDDGSFIRVTRTLDQQGNFTILSQDHYSNSSVASL